MSIIPKLRHHFPDNWKDVSDDDYQKSKYVLCEVDKASSEYEDIVAPFKDLKKMTLKRVQYPAAYLRFKMKSELNPESSSEEIKYILVNKSHLNIALKFNCDSRRDGVGEPESATYIISQIDGKPESRVIVIYKERNCYWTKYDDDKYPAYVITFDEESADENADLLKNLSL